MPQLPSEATPPPTPSIDVDHMVPGSIDLVGSERRANAVFWLYVAVVASVVAWGLAQAAFGLGPFGVW